MKFGRIIALLCLLAPLTTATTIAPMTGTDNLNYQEGEPQIVAAGPDGGDVTRFDSKFRATIDAEELQNKDLLKLQVKADRSAFMHIGIDNVPWDGKRGNWYFLDGLQPGFDWKTIWINLDRPEEGVGSSIDSDTTTLRIDGRIKDTGRSLQDAESIWLGDIRAIHKVVDVDWNQSRVSYEWNDDLTYSYPLEVSNEKEETVTAQISLDGYEAPHATGTLSQQQVELAPGESKTVTATLTLPANVANDAEPLYTERFKVTAKAKGYPESKVTVLRSADPIPLTVTVPLQGEQLDFPLFPTPSELPGDILRFDESMAREEASRHPEKVIENAKDNGIYDYNSGGGAASYRKTLIATAYLYDITGEQQYLDKSKQLLNALPDIWETFYAPYKNSEKRLISSGIIARMGDRAHYTLGLGWRLMGTQRSPYQYGTGGNNARGSMSSIFYAFDMIAPEMSEEARQHIIEEFIIPAGIQSRNHLIGDGNQQATVNSVALYAGLAGKNWPLAAFATNSDHGAHEIVDWTFRDDGLHIRDGYQTYTLRPLMWIGELLHFQDRDFYGIQRERLAQAYSHGGDGYFWDFVQNNRVSSVSVTEPTELTATATPGEKIRLVWMDSDNEARYVVERRTSPDSGFSRVATTRRDTPVHEDECTDGTTYHYRVKAYNYDGSESGYSSTATATCGDVTCTPSEEVCNGEDNDCDGQVDEGCNTPPSVSITQPGDGASFTSPAGLDVTAEAADNDGSIWNVTLQVNGETVRTQNAPPYEWGTANQDDAQLTNLSEGEYTLTVTAVDDDGVSSSTSLTVTVGSAVDPSEYADPNDRVSLTSTGVSVSDTVVYDTAYYWDGSWNEFSLSGEKQFGTWYLGSARSDANLSSARYVAVYSCSWTDGWDCHGDWQVWQR